MASEGIYFDLHTEIERMLDSDEVRIGIRRALGWLDEHSDLAPRRRITRTEFHAAQEAFTRRGEHHSQLALEDFAHRARRRPGAVRSHPRSRDRTGR